MLDLLARLIGPHRAVSVYAFLKSWGLALAAILLLATAATVLVTRGGDGPTHVAYLRAEVLGTTPINGDRRNGIIAELRLPQGDILNLTETEGLIANNLGETACVELRRDSDGSELYRLRRNHRCGL